MPQSGVFLTAKDMEQLSESRSETDETWPRYRNISYSDDVEFIMKDLS